MPALLFGELIIFYQFRLLALIGKVDATGDDTVVHILGRGALLPCELLCAIHVNSIVLLNTAGDREVGVVVLVLLLEKLLAQIIVR